MAIDARASRQTFRTIAAGCVVILAVVGVGCSSGGADDSTPPTTSAGQKPLGEKGPVTPQTDTPGGQTGNGPPTG